MKTFKCEACGWLFESEWSEEEAQAEMKENFSEPIPEANQAIVCDACYEKALGISGRN